VIPSAPFKAHCVQLGQIKLMNCIQLVLHKVTKAFATLQVPTTSLPPSPSTIATMINLLLSVAFVRAISTLLILNMAPSGYAHLTSLSQPGGGILKLVPFAPPQQGRGTVPVNAAHAPILRGRVSSSLTSLSGLLCLTSTRFSCISLLGTKNGRVILAMVRAGTIRHSVANLEGPVVTTDDAATTLANGATPVVAVRLMSEAATTRSFRSTQQRMYHH
jgi:hypothetical protein